MSPGPTQLIIILVIVLLLFGAKKIPELAKGLGTGMREFRQGASGELQDDKDTEDKTDKKDSSEDSASKGSAPESSVSENADGDIRSEDENSDEKANKTEQRS